MIEHRKRYQSLESAIKRLQRQVDDFQKIRFPVGSTVQVISVAGDGLVECTIVAYFAGLENADRVVVSPKTPEGRERLRAYRWVGDTGLSVPISQMLDEQSAANYLKCLETIGR